MRNRFRKQALCILLALSLVMGFMPVTSFAGYEDGIECEFCGGYRFDDWVCDDGPHCSDSSGASDCYYENHCAACLGPVENSERCDTCYICPDCMSDGVVLHCAMCGACDEGGYDVCPDCDVCMNCQIEAGTHCFECGDCLESGSQCPDHPFELYQENHCESCALKCPSCDDKCFLGETFIDIYCEEHELCVVCATDEGLHCKECYGCYEDELCSECQKCDECGLESGEHCPECDAHGEDWCEDGGEGTHCVECAAEFLCEQCNGCTSCNGTEFCDECGLCIECCVENAQSENCSCGEYCINSGNWEDHFCESCGNCFDEYEQCEYCGLCSDCCESESECSSGMCVEDPDYEEHFCSECNQCFDDVQLCEDCESVGELTCMDCCRDRTQQMNCEHDICVNHWEWSEHYCEACQTCYDLCEHLPIAHEHDYDDFDKCKICGASRSGAPYIIHQPTDVTCNVTDINDSANRGLNKVTFRVKASGENLTYQWFYKDKDGITRMAKDTLSSGYDDCVLFEGATTDTLTVWVKPDACNVIYEFGCGIANSKGRVESEFAKLNAKHVYGNVKPVLGDSATISYWSAEKLAVDSITYNLSSGHVQNCVGDGCGEALAEVPHRFSSWKQGAEATSAYTGYKSRECIDCGYVDYEVLPVLKEAHVHDYSYGYAQGDVYHWKQCVCAEKDMESREVHTFGEWTVTKPATMTANGEEQRTCTTCKYVEKRSTERQGHTHIFYDWDYISTNGHIIEDGVEVPPFMGDYGKTTRSNHYAYCIVEGCNEVKKEAHKFGATKWITYPTETADGVWYKLCGSCGYQYDGTAKAGRYPISNKNCKVNMQNALPGATVKVTPYEKYDGQYFSGKIFANFTTDLGKTYTYLEVYHHTPDASDDKDYYYFTYPEVPDDVVWTDVWVEVHPQLKKCTHRISLQNVVEATCGEAGYTGDMMCELCTYVESAGSTIPATGEHGDTYLSGKRDGTCTRKGYSGDIKCCDCDKIIEKGKPTDYYHPNYKYTISPLPATCTSEGHTYESVCLDCGKVLNKSRVLPKTKHRWEKFLEVPATCTTKGMKAHYQCTVCNRYSEDRENWFVSNRSLIIPSLGGHKWADATCAAPKTCTVCKETEGEKLDKHTADILKSDKDYHWSECACGETVIGKTAHTYDQTVVDDKYMVSAADCDSKAVYYKSCKCGVAGTNTFTYGEPLGHSEITILGKDATCTATGLTDGKKCNVCGFTITAQQTIPVKAHTYGSDHICDICGHDNSVPHVCSLTKVTEKAATCAETGKQAYYKCTCGKYYEDEDGTKVISNLNSWGIIGKDADKHVGRTETVNVKVADHKTQTAGYTGDTKCLGCGTILQTGKNVTPTAHNAGASWSIDGTHHWKVCTVDGCGIAVDKAAHGYGDDYVCDICKYENESLKPTPDPEPTPEPECSHQWNVASCTTAKTCKLCGKTDGDKLGHSYSKSYTVDKQATTTADGSKSKHCTRAGCDAKTAETTIYAASNVKLSYMSSTYNGKAKAPTVTVKDSKGNTIAAENYDLTKPSGRTKAGTYIYTIKFKNDYTGTKSLKLTVKKADMSGIKGKGKTVTYNGKSHTITLIGVPEGAKVYYKTSTNGKYSTTKPTRKNAGTTTVYYKVTKSNYNDETGKVKIVVNKRDISTASLAKTAYVYTGKAIKPAVTVKNSSKVKLTKGTHYTVTYKNNTKVGQATVTINGKGNYKGTIKKTFKINPVATKISGVTTAKKGFTVKWTKKTKEVTGYQICYGTSTNKDKCKKVLVTKNSTVSKKITKLTSGKKYNVWIRTYKTVGKTKYYSAWSAKKTVKVK